MARCLVCEKQYLYVVVRGSVRLSICWNCVYLLSLWYEELKVYLSLVVAFGLSSRFLSTSISE